MSVSRIDTSFTRAGGDRSSHFWRGRQPSSAGISYPNDHHQTRPSQLALLVARFTLSTRFRCSEYGTLHSCWPVGRASVSGSFSVRVSGFASGRVRSRRSSNITPGYGNVCIVSRINVLTITVDDVNCWLGFMVDQTIVQ